MKCNLFINFGISLIIKINFIFQEILLTECITSENWFYFCFLENIMFLSDRS